MRALTLLAFLFLLTAARCSSAEELERVKWTRAVVADEVAVSVNVVTIQEINRKTGVVADMHDLHESRHGFAVLYRAHSGELKCNVFVTKDATDATLEHELRHCHGWVHR